VNAVDIVILVILAFGVIAGFRQGFILQSASILGSIVALTVARAEYTPVRDALMRVAPHSPWLTAIADLLVFLVVWGAIVAAARRRAVDGRTERCRVAGRGRSALARVLRAAPAGTWSGWIRPHPFGQARWKPAIECLWSSLAKPVGSLLSRVSVPAR